MAGNHPDHSLHKNLGEDQMCHNDKQSELLRLMFQPVWQNLLVQDENPLQQHQKRECQHFLFLQVQG